MKKVQIYHYKEGQLGRNGEPVVNILTLNMYPLAVNCDKITNYLTCMLLPGCIYCLNYPDLRVLRETNNSVIESSVESSVEQTDEIFESSSIFYEFPRVNVNSGVLRELYDRKMLQIKNLNSSEETRLSRRQLYNSILPGPVGLHKFTLTEGSCSGVSTNSVLIQYYSSSLLTQY